MRKAYIKKQNGLNYISLPKDGNACVLFLEFLSGSIYDAFSIVNNHQDNCINILVHYMSDRVLNELVTDINANLPEN